MQHLSVSPTPSMNPSVAGSDVISEDDGSIDLPPYHKTLGPEMDSNLKTPLCRNASPLSLQNVSESPELNAKSMSHLTPNMVPNSDTSNQYTVEREEKNDTAKNYRRQKSVFLSILKCVLSMLMSICLLSCVVASKLSLVAIGQRLNYTMAKTSVRQAASNASLGSNQTMKKHTPHSSLIFCGSSKYGLYQCETIFNMLVLILMTPHIFAFLKALVSSGCKTSHPWPTKRAVAWGIVGSFLESSGLCLFVFSVLSIVKETDVTVVLMNAIFVVPVVWQLSRSCKERFSEDEMKPNGVSEELLKKHKSNHMKNMILSFLACILQVAGLVGIIFLIRGKDGKEVMLLRFILVPVSILLLSFSWCPELKKLQIDHDLEFVVDGEDGEFVLSNTFVGQKGGSPTVDHQSKNASLRSVSPTGRSKSKGSWASDPHKVILQTNSASGKATLINSMFKIVLVPLCSAAIVYAMKLVDLSNIGHGFKDFARDTTLLVLFCVQIGSSFFGYYLAYLACTATIQRLAFAFPLTLSTPVAVILLVTNRCSDPYMEFLPCQNSSSNWLYVGLLSVALWLGQFFATTYYAWKSQDFIMAGESVLFWVPAYEGAMLEQNLLLNRKNEATNEYFVNYQDLVTNSSIYVCTTMYHEEAFEMEQLLNSIAGLDNARREAGRKMEAHVFFDDGVRDKTLKKYALQLLSLLDKTLDVQASSAMKISTPYGVQLKWKLAGDMMFYIHLKDNFKVKNKKRWSQVMYMSYVLDFREIGKHDHAYILTTDADVRFSPDDVMALMDRMSRDPRVGAVCGRTHPLGSGPLVWYQVFDYAIGHWLLKVAEDVLGSVLCSPGCFSIYRASAVRDVLPTYASHVECAMDFLTKDMGEDRWFCTLLVEKGWRLEYCAAAKNSTYCPDNFNEFFKQRRRWTPSTIANQIVLIQKSSEIRRNNDAISSLFIFYQMLLMISTVVGPANVVFVISTGLSAAYPSVSMVGMFITVILTIVVYTMICLYFPQDFQLKVAQLLTFLFSVIMTITFVGLLAGIADDIIKNTSPKTTSNVTATLAPNTLHMATEEVLKLAPSNIYLVFLAALFICTALLHGFEGLSVIHGIWYLLCLPSGYLFLTIYSVANMTDRSWGTREGKTSTSPDARDPWVMLKNFWHKTKMCCSKTCRRKQERHHEEEVDMSDMTPEGSVNDAYSEAGELSSADDLDPTTTGADTEPENKQERVHHPRALRTFSAPKSIIRTKTKKFQSRRGSKPGDGLLSMKRDRSIPGVRFKSMKFDSFGAPFAFETEDVVQDIREWLQGRYENYIDNFKDHGYDDTTFLLEMKEQDLLDIGITNRGHRRKLVREIERLPPEEIENHVPDNVREWLIKFGLENYWPKFKENSYTEPNSLADLKFMDKNTLRQNFQISKEGHLKKLMKAIKHLQYPSSAQRKIQKARTEIDKRPWLNLKREYKAEFDFWTGLREVCLLPEQAAFSSSDELKSKLEELRNAALLMLGISNIIWITLMLSIMAQGQKLAILGTNFLGLSFLILFTLVLVLQFFTLLIHRVGTWIHLVSRIPFKPGAQVKLGWSFSDEDLPPTPTDEEMLETHMRLSNRLSSQSRRKKSIRRVESARFRSVRRPSNFYVTDMSAF